MDWDNLGVHSELRHLLALGYSWYQLQLDEHELSGWRWHRWLRQYRRKIVGILSLNYDLVVERSLYWNQVPYYYPGTTTEDVISLSKSGPGVRPIPV